MANLVTFGHVFTIPHDTERPLRNLDGLAVILILGFGGQLDGASLGDDDAHISETVLVIGAGHEGNEMGHFRLGLTNLEGVVTALTVFNRERRVTTEEEIFGQVRFHVHTLS